MITSRDPATPAVTWGDSGLSIRLHRKVEVAAGGRGVIVVFAVIVVVDCCGGYLPSGLRGSWIIVHVGLHGGVAG